MKEKNEVKERWRNKMTEKEKEEKNEGEVEKREALDAIRKDSEEFYNTSDAIFRCFEGIYNDYLRGRDIRGDLKGFADVKSGASRLIGFILRADKEDVEKTVKEAGITKEESDKIFEFLERYSDLADEIKLAALEEGLGFINPVTNIAPEFAFNEEHGIPIIELKAFSRRKEILYLKNSSVFVYSFTKILQTAVKNCLRKMKDKDIATSELEKIKDIANDLQKDAQEILDVVKEIEKKKGGEE